MPAVNGNVLEESAHTVATMSHQHSMPTVNVPIVLWEPLGTFWRSLLFFGNLWEPFGGIYCSLGTVADLANVTQALWVTIATV